MDVKVETLGTDEFRHQHTLVAGELHEIEAELARARAQGLSWRSAAPNFRRLLVLLEVDVRALIDDEEHAIYAPLREHAGVLSPTLAACYHEHHDIRVLTQELHEGLLAAFCGHEPVPDALFARAAELIELVRLHMAREDAALFPSVEQEIPREELLSGT